jgi:NAD(P)-dependent dehydrogenase (short-subunit alcohol dehydrogenase family)
MSDGNDKTAIITGGSRGLGRNTAIRLAARGVDLLFTHHSNLAEAQNLIREVEAMGRKAAAFQLDAGNISLFDGVVDQVRNMLRVWGRDRFDYLVNNAGTSLHKPFDQTSEAEFDQIVNVHFKGVYFLTQKAPAAHEGRRPHCEHFVGAGALQHFRHFSLWGGKRRNRSIDALPGEGAWGTWNHGQRRCPRGDRNRLQWRDGARQSGD